MKSISLAVVMGLGIAAGLAIGILLGSSPSVSTTAAMGTVSAGSLVLGLLLGVPGGFTIGWHAAEEGTNGAAVGSLSHAKIK